MPATWRLPSAFLPRFRGDPLAELHTNAYGVIGEFVVGSAGKSDLVLNENASHFVVLEAKIFSLLSKGVTHAPFFDQAARNVAKRLSPLSVKNGEAVLWLKLEVSQGPG